MARTESDVEAPDDGRPAGAAGAQPGNGRRCREDAEAPEEPEEGTSYYYYCTRCNHHCRTGDSFPMGKCCRADVREIKTTGKPRLGESNRELQPLAAAAKPSRKRKRSRAVSPERGGPRPDGGLRSDPRSRRTEPRSLTEVPDCFTDKTSRFLKRIEKPPVSSPVAGETEPGGDGEALEGCMKTCGFPGARQAGATSSQGNGSRVPEARVGCDMKPGVCMGYEDAALYQVSGCYKGKYCEACLRVLTDEASRLGQAIETVELKPRREKEPTVNPEPRPPEEGDVLKERWQRPQERSVLTTTRRELWPLTPRELTETYGKGYHILVKMGYTRENELRTGSARAPLRVGEPRTSRPGLRASDESGGKAAQLEHAMTLRWQKW